MFLLKLVGVGILLLLLMCIGGCFSVLKGVIVVVFLVEFVIFFLGLIFFSMFFVVLVCFIILLKL